MDEAEIEGVEGVEGIEGVEGVDSNTHFAFEHKVFSVEGSYFAAPDDIDRAKFYMPLGDVLAAVPVRSLRDEFSIADGSVDASLLDIVEKSLRYVKAIRPNDSIPKEVLDGSASWAVEEKHRVIARGRITLQLVGLMTGNQEEVVDLAQLEALTKDPEAKARVDEAFAELAEQLGLGRQRKQEVVRWIDHLVHELSFIEALRDHFRYVLDILTKMGQLATLYRNDQTMVEVLNRIMALLRGPIGDYRKSFERLDRHTGKILTVLRDIEQKVAFIRMTRDDLHRAFMLWDETIEGWQEREPERCDEVDQLVKATYQFLARNFPQAQDWVLTTRK